MRGCKTGLQCISLSWENCNYYATFLFSRESKITLKVLALGKFATHIIRRKEQCILSGAHQNFHVRVTLIGQALSFSYVSDEHYRLKHSQKRFQTQNKKKKNSVPLIQSSLTLNPRQNPNPKKNPYHEQFQF